MKKLMLISIFIIIFTGCAEKHLSNDFIYIKKSGEKPVCTHLGKTSDCKKTAEIVKGMN